MSKINNDWKEILEEEFEKEYFVKLKEILEEEYKNYTVYPPKRDILNAFFLTPYSEVKVSTSGTGSISSERTSTWISIFCKLWNKNPTITCKYV